MEMELEMEMELGFPFIGPLKRKWKRIWRTDEREAGDQY